MESWFSASLCSGSMATMLRFLRETIKFCVNANYDACAFSVLTPYPGTLTWYEMKNANQIVSFDWSKYDQGNVVFRPAHMSADELRLGQQFAYDTFYTPSSIARRFPIRGKRNRLQWLIYNLFMKKGSATERREAIAEPTELLQRRPCHQSFLSSESGANWCSRTLELRTRAERVSSFAGAEKSSFTN